MKTPIELNVKIGYHNWAGFYAVDQNYEPGYPQGQGKTIREALEDYLEQAKEFYAKFNYSPLTYTWS